MSDRVRLCVQCKGASCEWPSPICDACRLRNVIIFEWEGALNASTPEALRVVSMILAAAMATRDPFFLNNPFRALAQLTDAITSGSIEEASRAVDSIVVH